MATLTFQTSWNKFVFGKDSLIMSPADFKEQWLFGIPTTSLSGASISDDVIKQWILQSQTYVENYLGVKLFKQKIIETQDFIREQYFTWGFIKTDYQINEALSLTGQLNERGTIVYPKEWLTIKRGNIQEYANNLYIIPNGQGNVTLDFLATTYSQWFSFYGARILPNYWKIEYCTGFDDIPYDIQRLIGLLTTVNALMVLEMGVGPMGGAMFGIAGNSLSLDGMSQNVNKMNGGNIFQQRIKATWEEARNLLSSLRVSYGGIKFDVA